MMDKQKSYWIDALKAFGILLVVIGHSSVPSMMGKLIYGFHMPLFFMISGYLFNEEKWLVKGLRAFAKNRWSSYIKLYFIWCTINLVFNIPIELLNYSLSFQELLDSTIKHIWWVIISYGGYKDFPNCTPLWFLPCLFVASLYLFGLVRLEQRKGFKYALLVSLLMLITNFALGLIKDLILPWHIDVALGASVFMFIGYKIRKDLYLSKNFSPVILISLFLLGIMSIFANERIDMNMNQFGNYPLFYVGASLVSFVLMYLFFKASRITHESVIIRRLGGGRNSIIILALNYFLNTIFSMTIGRLIPHQIGWILDVLFVMTVSYLVIYINERLWILQPQRKIKSNIL